MRKTKSDRQSCTAYFLAALLFGSSAIALDREPREDYSRNFQKSVTWQSGQTVSIEHRNGDIHVVTHKQSQLNVGASIRVSADTAAEAAQFGNQIQIQVDQASGSILIRTDYPETRGSSFFRRKNISHSVNYEIMMPENAPLQIKNSFGNVTVLKLKASSGINNSHGKLIFRDGRGVQKLQNSFGSIEVTGIIGNVSINNNHRFVN